MNGMEEKKKTKQQQKILFAIFICDIYLYILTSKKNKKKKGKITYDNQNWKFS